MSQDDNEIKGHDYDGITEYDNPLPIWWLATFIGTIIFAFIYFMHYEIGGGPTMQQDLKIALTEIEKIKANQPSDNLSEDQLTVEFKNQNNILAGAQVYQGKCAVCHGNDLQGVIGPNLVDSFWIHTQGTKAGLVKTIANGVTEKGMPAWKELLKGPEILQVASFIYSKKGSSPANPKPAQGDKIDSY